MISVLDSFLMYLQTELAGAAIPVHWVHQDPTDTTAHLITEDALNVSVLSIEETGSMETLMVSLDVVGSDERTMFSWVKVIRDVLLKAQYTPEIDFQGNPQAPQSTGRMVSWSGDDVNFVVMAKNERYLHFNATFHLRHSR